MLTSVATIFAIDFGFVFAGVVVLIVLAAYSYNLNEGLWRVCFGLGVVIPIALLFFRLRIVNSTQYHKHAMKKNIPYMLVLKRYWKPMLGTSLAWFVYDFVVWLQIPTLCLKRRVLTFHTDLPLWTVWINDYWDAEPQRLSCPDYWIRYSAQLLLFTWLHSWWLPQ